MEKKNVLTGKAIVVADRGFVYIGDVEYDGELCIVRNGYNIRRWGTERGLGELALEGPKENTKLDKISDVTIPSHAVNHIIDTDAGLWSN